MTYMGLRWARQDLNLRPIDYESTALTTELRAQNNAFTGKRARDWAQRYALVINSFKRDTENLMRNLS